MAGFGTIDADPRPPDLSVIIPVFNAEATLGHVVDDFLALDEDGIDCQVILVDDASTDGTARLVERLAAQDARVLALHHGENRGAGVARMTGWPEARGRYALFFDADDILHADVLARTLRRLEAQPQADTAMLAYRYERGRTNTGLEMSYQDTRIFRRLLVSGTPALGTPDEMADLLLVTNYPWNKVIRTAHFRAVGLRFGATKVNNDILGHWQMLLKARRILLCDEVICTHIVETHGANITNRFTDERLQMLDALEELYAQLEAQPALRQRHAARFWELAHRLFLWARERMEPGLVPRLDERWARLIGRIDLGDYAELRMGRAPALASALANHLLA